MNGTIGGSGGGGLLGICLNLGLIYLFFVQFSANYFSKPHPPLEIIIIDF